MIRTSIIEGQPKTHRPWTKIVILVEGIYSMEGDLCPLKEFVQIKNKYKVCSFSFVVFNFSAICMSMKLIR